MGLPDPKPQFTYLVRQLRNHNLAYLHVIEPCIAGIVDAETIPLNSSDDFLRKIWCEEDDNRVFISAGGYTRQTAIETVEEKGGIVAFGRLFIPNVSLLDFRLPRSSRALHNLTSTNSPTFPSASSMTSRLQSLITQHFT